MSIVNFTLFYITFSRFPIFQANPKSFGSAASFRQPQRDQPVVVQLESGFELVQLVVNGCPVIWPKVICSKVTSYVYKSYLSKSDLFKRLFVPKSLVLKSLCRESFGLKLFGQKLFGRQSFGQPVCWPTCLMKDKSKLKNGFF